MAQWDSRIVGEGTEAPDQLLANPQNWRVHPADQQEALAEVLDKVGWVQRVIVNRTTGHVIDGHLRVSLAISRGEQEIPVTYVELDTEEERYILATLDPLSALAAADRDMLGSLLEEIDVGDAAVASMIEDIMAGHGNDARGETEGDTEPEDPAQVEIRVHEREVWLLDDRHVLMCGDSTDFGLWERGIEALGEPEVDLLLTDPPYGVEYTGGSTGDREMIENDDLSNEALKTLMIEAWQNVASFMSVGTPFYVFHANWKTVPCIQAVEEMGWHLSAVLVWVKQRATLGWGHYQWMHEPILYGWGNGKRDDVTWNGARDKKTVLEFANPTRSKEHPTMKPVDLLEFLMTNSSNPGDLVADPFGGSGSTLIAAENLGRSCIICELDPKYATVILNRWERHTGKEGKLLLTAQEEATAEEESE